jgi:hypothetical protein
MYAFLTRRLKEKNHQKIFAETKRRKEKPAKIFLPNNQFDHDLSHSIIITTKM